MYEAKPLQSGNLFQNGTRSPNGRHIVNLKVVESPHESSLEMSFPIKIP